MASPPISLGCRYIRMLAACAHTSLSQEVFTTGQCPSAFPIPLGPSPLVAEPRSRCSCSAGARGSMPRAHLRGDALAGVGARPAASVGTSRGRLRTANRQGAMQTGWPELHSVRRCRQQLQRMRSAVRHSWRGVVGFDRAPRSHTEIASVCQRLPSLWILAAADSRQCFGVDGRRPRFNMDAAFVHLACGTCPALALNVDSCALSISRAPTHLRYVVTFLRSLAHTRLCSKVYSCARRLMQCSARARSRVGGALRSHIHVASSYPGHTRQFPSF